MNREEEFIEDMRVLCDEMEQAMLRYSIHGQQAQFLVLLPFYDRLYQLIKEYEVDCGYY